MSEKVEDGIFANSTTRTIRNVDFTMHEVTLEDIGKLQDEITKLFSNVDPKKLASGNISAVIQLILSKETIGSLKSILALVTRREKSFFNKLPLLVLKDLVKLFFEVNPLSEMKELFSLGADQTEEVK